MATLLGTVQSISGVFFSRNAGGEVVTLKVGDSIYEGDVVYGSNSNDSSDILQVVLSSGDVATISGVDSQVFDENALELIANAGDETILEEETAAGDEGPTSSDSGVFSFDTRDGGIVDVTSGLRNDPFGTSNVIVDPTDNLIGDTTEAAPEDTPEDTPAEFYTPSIVFNITESVSQNTVDVVMGGYEGRGYNSFINSGNMQSAQAAITFEDGWYGVANQNTNNSGQGQGGGSGGGGNQSVGIDNGEALVFALTVPVNEAVFAVQGYNEENSFSGIWIALDEDRNTIGSGSFNSNGEVTISSSTDADIHYIVFQDTMTPQDDYDGFVVQPISIDDSSIGFGEDNSWYTQEYTYDVVIEPSLPDGADGEAIIDSDTIVVDGIDGDPVVVDNNDGTYTYTYTLDEEVDMDDVTVSATVEYDGSSYDVISYGIGDDNIDLTDHDLIDGGEGDDTLVLIDGETIEFDRISNIETIDMNNASSNELSIDLENALDSLQEDTHITILGDVNDSLTLIGDWDIGSTEDGFTQYLGSDGDITLTLMVQEEIDVVMPS